MGHNTHSFSYDQQEAARYVMNRSNFDVIDKQILNVVNGIINDYNQWDNEVHKYLNDDDYQYIKDIGTLKKKLADMKAA